MLSEGEDEDATTCRSRRKLLRGDVIVTVIRNCRCIMENICEVTKLFDLLLL